MLSSQVSWLSEIGTWSGDIPLGFRGSLPSSGLSQELLQRTRLDRAAFPSGTEGEQRGLPGEVPASAGAQGGSSRPGPCVPGRGGASLGFRCDAWFQFLVCAEGDLRRIWSEKGWRALHGPSFTMRRPPVRKCLWFCLEWGLGVSCPF